jgi:uncharacterized membrane protein
MESLLYTISGLPVHALVVHFAVVVLPVAATALIALIYLKKIREKYAFITTIGIILGSASVLIAKQSGEALSEKIGLPVQHSDYGSLLTYCAFVFMVLTIFWYRSPKGKSSLSISPISHITALMAVAVLALTFLTGHTGAQAVWEGKLAKDAAPTSTPAPTSTSNVPGTFNLADLQKHATASSCWSAIDGNVYDLTKWIARHPGGQSVIKAICGKDGSASFNGQHAGASKPAAALAPYKIGKFA